MPSASGFFDSKTHLPSSDTASSRSVEVAEVASADDEIGEAWMEARTVLGAPSFAVLAAERAAAESASFEAPAEEAPLDPFESFETQHDAPSLASIEIPIDLDEPEPVALEVSIAPQSESAVWESLEGELGVFLATYDELPIGTEVKVTVHLTGERPFESRARVVWLRNAPGLWPGLGLRLLENRPDVWFRLQRFSRRWRAPMFQ